MEAKAYGFKIETYQVRIPPKKLTCAKNKERQSNCQAIADYLFSNAQVNVKRAKLNLASSERSYKLISKSVKNEKKFFRSICVRAKTDFKTFSKN